MSLRLGIDLGTTNTVVAAVQSGEAEVLELALAGDARLEIPTVFALAGEDRLFGREASDKVFDDGWVVVASPKRALGTPSPQLLESLAPPAERGALLERLFADFLARLADELREAHGEDRLEAMIGVPANANSLQRLRTLEAAEQAGIEVLGLVHEPTAAAIEFAHRHPGFSPGKAVRHAAVYDLGGGTFDASIVRIDDEGFQVLRSEGIERLGGDDFDRLLAELALQAVGGSWAKLAEPERARLLLRCRDAKEGLRPTTRRFLIEVAEGREATLSCEAFFEAAAPLVDRTIATLERLLAEGGLGFDDADALLVVGGASQFLPIRRRLKDVFGTRLRLAPNPFASTAIGLALHAARFEHRPVSERLSHSFGVWREADGGTRRTFDPLLGRDTVLPSDGGVVRVEREYRPHHNVGRLRFEECASVDDAGQPLESGTRWCEIAFPYDPALDAVELDRVTVERRPDLAATVIRESYECDSIGRLRVSIERLPERLVRSFLLYGPERVEAIARPRRRRKENDEK